MLRIYPVSLEVAAHAAQLADIIARRDQDLARQLRRASASVVLNLAEGFHSQGQNARARYYNALGSANETLACIELATVIGLIQQPEQPSIERIRRVIGTLVKLTRR